MKKTLTVILAALSCLSGPRLWAGDVALADLASPAAVPAKPARAYRAWKYSLAPLAATQVLDISSSYGMREMNPTLASSNGRFGAQSAALKIGITAGVIGLEYLMVHKHPRAARLLWKMNLASAGVTAGVAAHNYSLR